MSIATEVDALARRQAGRRSGLPSGPEGLTAAKVGYYSRRGRDLQAQAMNAALRRAAASVPALFSSALGTGRRKTGGHLVSLGVAR